MIEFKNVNKVFRKKRETIQALKNVSFKIDQHDIFGVIGYSGAGKSTLVRLVRQYQMVKLLLMVMRLIHIKKKIYVILKKISV